MKILTIITFLFFATTSFAQKPIRKNNSTPDIITHSDYIKNDINFALKLLNQFRRDAGLDTVSLSTSLSLGCDKHARYLVLNKNSPKTEGLNAHNEFKELPGFSLAGAGAGMNSDICEGLAPSKAVASFINSFYHRIPLLRPELKNIGIGSFEGGKYGTVTVLNCLNGRDGTSNTDIVYYPSDNQKNVPCAFAEGEIPNPVKSANRAGFPITIYFAQSQKTDSVNFRLYDKFHANIPCYLSTMQNPATDFPQQNTICAIPEKPLTDNREYHVSFSCSVDGKPFKKEYSFTTIGPDSSLRYTTYISPLSDFSTKWNDNRYLVCNTANEVNYLTENEKKVICFLNLARMNPKLFAETVLDEYAGMMGNEKMKSSTYFTSLVETMNSMQPVSLLKPDSLCYVSALCHAQISGSMGYEGHVRVKSDCQRKQHFMGECCDYGNDDPLDIVIALLIDEDVPSLGHRMICIDSTYSKLGVSIQPHKKYKHNAVLDFY